MDILPIQASAVPCERFFSSAADTDVPDRNRLSPALFEALQIIKFFVRQHRGDFNFVENLVAKEDDYSIHGPLTQHARRELIDADDFRTLADLEALSTSENQADFSSVSSLIPVESLSDSWSISYRYA
jgi:hypothetical protein